MTGWGQELWGNFPWGDHPFPNTVGTLSVIDQTAVAIEPLVSNAQTLTLGLINNSAVAFGLTTVVMGARGATSANNLRRGIHHGHIRGHGPFRSSMRIRGIDRGSTIRGYRIHGNAPRQRTAKQVTLGLISNAATTFPLQAAGSLIMGFVDNAATVFPLVEIQHGHGVLLGRIENVAVAYAPSMGNVNLELIDNAAVVFDMHLTIPLGLVDNAAVAFEPSFSGSAAAGRTITFALVDNSATVFPQLQVVRGEPRQINTPLVDNAAQAIQMFVRQEIPNVIRLKGSFDDTLTLEASYDDVIVKKVKMLGTKAPITKLDDWNEDEDQTFIWELPAGQNASGWTVRFRLALENGGAHLLEYSGVILSSTEVSIFAPAVDTTGLGGKMYFYELARIDSTHHQRIAQGPAYLGHRVS